MTKIESFFEDPQALKTWFQTASYQQVVVMKKAIEKEARRRRAKRLRELREQSARPTV